MTARDGGTTSVPYLEGHLPMPSDSSVVVGLLACAMKPVPKLLAFRVAFVRKTNPFAVWEWVYCEAAQTPHTGKASPWRNIRTQKGALTTATAAVTFAEKDAPPSIL